MESFHQLYKKYRKTLELETNKLRRTLETLEETRKDAKMMQKAIQVSKFCSLCPKWPSACLS